MNKLSEKLNYYAKNKPYMVGLNKLLPIPQCINRWKEEQKQILRKVTKIEDELKSCDVKISELEYIKIVKDVLSKANIKHGIVCYLFDTEEKNDSKGFAHSYNTYKYLLNIIDENDDIIEHKEILTSTKIDEPTPYLAGSICDFSLINLLKNENVLRTLKEYPEIATSIASLVSKKETKKEL